MTDEKKLYDVAIIGGGPGGMTAAIYAGRGLMKTLLLEKLAFGGMVLSSERFHNYPGFPDGIGSFELAEKFEAQVRKFNAEIVMDNVTSLKFFNGGPLFEIVADYGTFYSKSVVVASGSKPRQLEAKGAKELFGKGISTCAVCDGAFYRDKDIAVVGGGYSAVEEGMYLTKFAGSVTIIHRRDEFRAPAQIVKVASCNPKIKFLMDSVVDEVLGDVKVAGLKIKNVKTGEISDLDVAGVFTYIGATGVTEYIELPLEFSEHNYIKTGPFGDTAVPGIFAVGDVRSEPYKQAVIACGQGAQAALMADKYIKNIPAEVLVAF